MRTLAAIALVLASLANIADAKPRHARVAKRDTAWMRSCIHERTGPDGGIPVSEARAICKAEQPDDDVAAARAQLSLARANAKIVKARARAAKAIEACEQAVVDACVAAAKPDGSTNCEDENLKPAFAQCH
jgi:hypothetical protein